MDSPTQNLPLLPLTSGVVLPGMVFTMALESDEARAATEAAGPYGSFTANELAAHYSISPLYSLGDFGQGVHVGAIVVEGE